MGAKLLNPVYWMDGWMRECALSKDGCFTDGTLSVTISRAPLSLGQDTSRCEKLTAGWKNLSGRPLHIQACLQVQTDFRFTHYVIPGVSLNGNNWGKGKEPKGLLCGGEPWVFDYRRTTIPACTISEDASHYMALMASDADPSSLQASCSMLPCADQTMIHRILYPCLERPETYCTRDDYCEAHEDFLTLQPGEVFETTAFLLTGRPARENFAAADVEDAALELLGTPFAPRYSPDEVKELALAFASRLLTSVNGRSLFSIGQVLQKDGTFQNAEGYTFGWCGQNGMYARLFLEAGFEKKDPSLCSIAISNLDAWSHEAVAKTGLIHTHYDWMLQGGKNIEDTCNLGFAVLELTCAWQIAQSNGADFPDWLRAAKSTAAFFITHYSEQYGFGKAWDVEAGLCTDPCGTIGAYLIPGLAALFKATGENIYLETAKKACRFYRDRDLARFQCTAGALDTYCIDKESSGPLLEGSLALYGAEPSAEWLECARMAGYYFCSWMFHHDTVLRRGSDFERYHYRTLGGTSVSVQHHHIDPWGALLVPALFRLYELTGDWHWKRRASLIWANAIQNIAPPEGVRIHGAFRAAGAQNEGYHHCCWGDAGAPGLINDWLVAWPQAYCWNTANFLSLRSDFATGSSGPLRRC